MQLSFRIIIIIVHVLFWVQYAASTAQGDYAVKSGSIELAWSQLQVTLTKIYPIEEFSLESAASPHSNAPRFCWKFFRPGVDGYKRFVDVLLSYEGSIRWVVSAGGRRDFTCIAPAKADIGRSSGSTFTAYPPIANSELPSMPHFAPQLRTDPQFISEAIADIPRLVTYLERVLRLENTAPKTFNEELVAPAEPPAEDVLTDFIERGTHVTWILSPNADKRNMRERKLLHFGITEEEWEAIRSVIINREDRLTLGSHASLPELPLLSRISPHDGVRFSSEEVGLLRNECLRMRKSAPSPLAIRGLDKLLLMCNWAQFVDGAIYLAAP